MSSRQLKKLRAQEELARQASLLEKESGARSDEDDEDEDEDSGNNTGATRPKNAFSAFAVLGDDNDEGEDEVDEEADETGQGTCELEKPEALEESRAKSTTANKKKKKKKKAKGVKSSGNHESIDVAGQTKKLQETTPNELDDIDRALAELNLKSRTTATLSAGTSSSSAALSSHPTASASAPIIRVNLGDLRVMNELREVFGRETVQAAQSDDAVRRPGGAEGNPAMLQVDLETYLRADPPPPRGMVRLNNGGSAAGAMAGLVAKRNPFIQWKETWPRATSGGLSMRQVTEEGKNKGGNGVVEFTFVHSPAYMQLEDMFYTMTQMMDPQAMIQFLKHHPFHISSLILVSIIAKVQDRNASLAADLCERALFSFGRATLSSFRTKLAGTDGKGSGGGRAQLSFRRPENRQFLLVGYHYIRSLIGRGTYRTALAWAKLFLSVMPNDEYALILYAQTLAVQAFESRWLIDYCGTRDGENETLPCLMSNPMSEYIRQSLVPARLQIKDTEGARAALAHGMARLPWLYGALFQALGMDVPRAIWGIQPRDDAEILYTQLYIHLAKDVWDVPQATALLSEVAKSLVKVDASSSSLAPSQPITLTIARFVFLDNTPALMALVPEEMLHAQPNSDFDPLPPPRDENVFSNPSQLRPWIVAQNGAEGRRFLFTANDDDDDEDDGADEEDFGFDEDDFMDEFDSDLEGRFEEDLEEGEEGYEDTWHNPSGMPGAWQD